VRKNFKHFDFNELSCVVMSHRWILWAAF